MAVEASNINQIAVNSQPGYPKCNNGGAKQENASWRRLDGGRDLGGAGADSDRYLGV